MLLVIMREFKISVCMHEPLKIGASTPVTEFVAESFATVSR